MKKYLYMALIALLCSCEEDAKIKTYVYPEPEVDEVYPESGYVGSEVAVIGDNFGDRAEAVKIYFGGVQASEILSCKNNRVIARVPENAQTGEIGLVVWTHRLDSVGTYTVIPTPKIASVFSMNEQGESFAVGGDEVVIYGEAFGDDPSVVTVTVNGMAAEILSVMDNEIHIRVPDNYGSGMVVVTVNGYVMEASALIDPSVKGDVTHLFLKNYAQPFQRSSTDEGEWDNAIYWVKNAVFAGNSLHFTEKNPDGILSLNGATNKWNGALYQTTNLSPGEYEFQVTTDEVVKGSGRFGAQFVVMKGEGDFPGLADKIDGKSVPWTFSDMTGIICNVNIAVVQQDENPVVYTCEAVIEEATQVKIGFATMLANSNSVGVTGIKIIRK